MELTSLDLSVLEKEFQELDDGFVQKVYQRQNELTVEIYVPGEDKKRLIIGPSYCFLSKYKRDNPERPPGFCMELRKHLGKVDEIRQKGFDRILEIRSGEKKLIAELFGKGNVILTREGEIMNAMRQGEFGEREILQGKEYRYPGETTDPRELDDVFQKMGEGEVVRRLAADLSLGGTYAEEACERARVDKNREIKQLGEEEKQRVREALNRLFEKAESPSPVLYKDEKPVRAAPFTLENYTEYELERFDSFSRALDEFYYRKEKREKQQKRKSSYQEKKEGLERQLEQQERKIQGLEKSSKQNRQKAELIYENYQKLHKLQKAIKEGIEKLGWKEAEQKIMESEKEEAEMINSFNEQEEFVSVEIENRSIKLEPDESLEAIASKYYDKAKQSEEKMSNAREALEDTREKLEELELEDVEVDTMEDKSEKRSKKWFEKYRWFYSSEGNLVIVGRDAQTNEMAAKKHMESNDLYFHADFDGAPAVVVKDGKNAGEKTLQEAAEAAVTFSKTWKAGIGADDVYYVEPDQVTKNPESGEYLEKGAFVIRGEREYMRNVSVNAALGVYEIEGEKVPMCGPLNAVKENCDSFVKLEPGRTKKSELAKEIRSKFREQGYDLDLDYIIRSLPPGKSKLN